MMEGIRTIVVGYDGSDSARHALERVAELARNGAVVTVVSAPPVRFTSLGPQPPGGAEIAEHGRQLEEAHCILVKHGIEARRLDKAGIPADVILEEAASSGADLIVVGTGRKNVAERLVLGSVSEKVVHHAPCSVLVVR
jgi:nucleotide-binding universal stress UspA family protein